MSVYFTDWGGVRHEFMDLIDAQRAAFEECCAVLHGKYAERAEGAKPEDITICLFDPKRERFCGQVRVSSWGWDYDEPARASLMNAWTPAEYGGGAQVGSLTPEEYALVLAHRRQWSQI